MFPTSIRSSLIVLVLLLGMGHYFHSCAAQKRLASSGSIAEPPVQVNGSTASLQRNGYLIEPIAEYTIRARVLGVERYRIDREADLSPVDFALGWGPMSDHRITDQLNISQGKRWYQYRWSGVAPIDVGTIIRTSANTHMVPADEDIKNQLLKVRPGDTVTLKGRLINVKHPDGWRWHSSTSREDSGAGSCELLLVGAVSIE